LGRGQAKRRESQHNVAPRVVDGDASCDAPLQPPQPPRQATVADEAKHEAPQCTDSWGDASDHPACDIGLNARSSPSADKAAAATVLDRDEGNNGGLCFGTALTALDSVASFHAMSLPRQLLCGVEALGFSAPSRVQQLATKPMIDGRDTIAQAPAGQGKTGAFAVGSLAQVDVARRELQVVVVSPSKELCKQTADVYMTLGQHMGTSAAVRSSRFQESPTGVRVEAFIGGVQSVGDTGRSRQPRHRFASSWGRCLLIGALGFIPRGQYSMCGCICLWHSARRGALSVLPPGTPASPRCRSASLLVRATRPVRAQPSLLLQLRSVVSVRQAQNDCRLGRLATPARKRAALGGGRTW